jgi:hypothetical protein
MQCSEEVSSNIQTTENILNEYCNVKLKIHVKLLFLNFFHSNLTDVRMNNAISLNR